MLNGIEITRPDQVRCVDITYVGLPESFAYPGGDHASRSKLELCGAKLNDVWRIELLVNLFHAYFDVSMTNSHTV